MSTPSGVDYTGRMLVCFTELMHAPNRQVLGREHEVAQVLAGLARPEVSNVILLGPAGSGKTSVVQEVARHDDQRDYLEVDLARLIAEHGSEGSGGAIKNLFDEAQSRTITTGREVVLFLDEFHQLVQLSPAAVEAIKPVLAASGVRRLRMIAATTFEEFQAHIWPNQPLVERLQRINLAPPSNSVVVEILQGMAQRYSIEVGTGVLESIVELTNRYQPASAQPRKAILVLDAMTGWHRTTTAPMDHKLLAEVLEASTGVRISIGLDAPRIKEQLDAEVLSQDLATRVVADRLQLVVADLHDPTRPLSSLLFTGSSGVGKTALTKALAHVLFGDDQQHLIRFDMTEFAEAKSMGLFRSELTSRVWAMGHGVVMLDEIEKAHAIVTRLLLQVLDDGRLSDDNGRQVSFLNCHFVLTTNAASEIYKVIGAYESDDTGSGKPMVKRMREIRRSLTSTVGGDKFPPELLGRIDAIVPFQPLSLETQRRIVTGKLLKLGQEVLRKHQVRISFDRRLVDYLIDDNGEVDTNAGGARNAVALLTSDVVVPIAAAINANPGVSELRVFVDGLLRSEDKHLLVSGATVRVTPVQTY